MATLILIIPSFVFFYGWSQVQRTGSDVEFAQFALPHDYKYGITGWHKWQKLSAEDLRDARRILAAEAQSTYGQERFQSLMSEFGQDSLFTTKDLINAAIDKRLLMNYAAKQHVSVTEAQVNDTMAKAFSGIPREQWQRYLDAQNLTAEAFQNSVRTSLWLDRAALGLMGQARISLSEAWQAFQLSDQQIQLDYVMMRMDQFRSKVQATSESLKTYYGANKEEFRTPAQRQYRFAYFNKSKLEPQVKVTPEELAAYYEANKKNYEPGPEALVRQILIRLPAMREATDSEMQAAQQAAVKKAQGLKKQAETGADFAKLADENSEDPKNTGPEGKKLGGKVDQWISKDPKVVTDFGQDYVQNVLNLTKGKISDPILFQNPAYNAVAIVKIEDTRDQGAPPLEAIKDKVEKDLHDQKLNDLFAKKRDEFNEKIKSYTDIESMAKNLGMEDKLSSWSLVTDPMIAPELGYLPPADTAYIQKEMKAGDRSDLLGTSDALYVIQVSKEKPSFIPSFDEVKSKVEMSYKTFKAREMMKAVAEEIKANAKDLASLKALAEAKGFTVETSKPFVRNDVSQVLGVQPKDFAQDSMLAKIGDIRASEVQYSPTTPVMAYVVWRVAGLTDPSKEKFDQQLPTLERSLLMMKQKAMVDEWLYDQRKIMADKNLIKVNKDILREDQQ